MVMNEQERESEREPFYWDDRGSEMTFVENMRMLRERRGMSQTEFAKRASEAGLSFHQPTVQRIESGQRPLKLTESLVIAQILGSSLEQMMSDVSLPFAYSALAQGVSWDELRPALEMLISGRGVSWHITQIEEWLNDYKETAVSFGEEPSQELLDRAQAVLDLLARVDDARVEMIACVGEVAQALEELPEVPLSAHGGTPWDDVDG